MTTFFSVLLVAVGGGIGALARWGITEAWHALRSHDEDSSILRDLVPWPTFVANILATFLLGVFVTQIGSASVGVARYVYLLMGIGVCGSMSTISTVAYEIVDLARRRSPVLGMGYLSLSIGAGMGALWLGLVVAS